MSPESDGGRGVRLDKWLWAARFFKTRALATEAVSGGKVHVNGQRVKPARALKAGDTVTVHKGELAFEVVVEGLSERRGPASVAQTLYVETEASVAAREARAAERAHRVEAPRPNHRPDKKARRELRRFSRGE